MWVPAPPMAGKEKLHQKPNQLSWSFRNYPISSSVSGLPQPSAAHSPNCIETLKAGRTRDTAAASALQHP